MCPAQTQPIIHKWSPTRTQSLFNISLSYTTLYTYKARQDIGVFNKEQPISDDRLLKTQEPMHLVNTL
jgi:hypothetical protein